MEDPPPGPIDAAQLRRLQEQSRLRIEAAQARALSAKAALAEQSTTASSPDRAVTVTVGSAGTLLDLTIAPTAGKVPMPTLARTILSTYRAATLASVARTEDILRTVVGADDPALALVRTAVTEQEEA